LATSTAGFAAAYAAVRFVLVAQYFRARHVPEARPLTTTYLTGHGAAAVLWLLSAFVPAPGRYWLWALAFAIDLGTPWLAVRHSAAAPIDAAHLPERFGLFTLILLGESVVAVMQGMESQEDWTPAAAVSAFVGMGISFLIWWWYFDGVSAEQQVRTRRDAVRFHVWSYAHFPLYLGIVVAGVGVQRSVTAASRFSLSAVESTILTTAVAAIMLAMTIIAATSASQRAKRSGATIPHLSLTVATLTIGMLVHDVSAAVLVVVLAALCLSQVAVSLAALSDVHAEPAVAESYIQKEVTQRASSSTPAVLSS